MAVRKNFLFLSSTERAAFLEALLKLKANIVNPGDPAADQYSVYDQFVFLHLAVFEVINPNTGTTYNAGHQGAAFLSWHRELLLRFEAALQAEVPGVMLPYWDWSAAIFTDAFLGPNGGAGGSGGGTVRTGLFAYDKPGTGTNTFPLPAYFPASLAGWRIRPDLDDTADGTALRRFFGDSPGDVLPTFSSVNSILSAGTASTFRSLLEAGSSSVSSHNEVHRYIGGHMGAAASPNDPIFWLHHCNIDRLWAMWQLDGHAGTTWFPSSAAFGHTLASAMWPWTGSTVYALPSGMPTYYLPDFTGEPARTNGELLDHHALGYAYDTEPVVGVAVDRSGSMTGMTSDPLASMAPITKWNLARKGVEHFLADCQAAYDARAAYVIGGVSTFTSVGVSPTCDPVVTAQPWGLVRAGGSYPPATVNTALAALSASGGTPLATAITETHDELVRPPTNALPSDDIRYLALLTDGKETVAPNLSTLATGGLADTLVFGMGLGNGTSWDGVDYATIQTIVEKGRNPSTAASRVFHGENAGVIDKFFTNTIATAIGYTMAIDPRFDLFPGEHTHLPFYVTSADDSLMITVQRGDTDDARWHVALYDPNGRHHDADEAGPLAFVFRRSDGRHTIFVHRNGVDDERWIGRWHVHVAYLRERVKGGHAHAEHAHGEAVAEQGLLGGMAMINTWDMLVPAGAPPLRGPVFAQFDRPMKERLSVRLLPSASVFRSALGGPVLEDPADARHASAVQIGIYMHTTLHVHARFDGDARFAGAPLRLSVEVDETLGAKIDDLRVLGRLIAPRFSPGAALRDLDTVPLAAREKLRIDDEGVARFDQLAFLAAYERKRPGVFAPRDERIHFTREDDARHVAVIHDTRVPGSYHAGIYVEGMLRRGDGKPEWFARVVGVDRGLATRLDPRRSRPLLHWVGPSAFVVTMAPQDADGNSLAPHHVDDVVLRLGGVAINAKRVDGLDGTMRLEGKFHEGLGTIAADGRSFVADTHVHGPGGTELHVAKGAALRLTVELSGQVLPVRQPVFVGHAGKAHLPASADVFAVPIEKRTLFDSIDEVTRSGLAPPAGGGRKGDPPAGPGHHH
ncbi:MAG TPA: tyrosinase family protein [Nannocystaceae bacterium]|nr:tyrosinase family protein [Nannocystaceae bacterium]